MNCPKCHRPVNEGNSPNAAECHETDGDDGVCEAYAKVHELREALESAKEQMEGAGLFNGMVAAALRKPR